ncbi:MAG: SDR family oxidoreductase [Candidatus Omnitrophica bacterium]|nr:SDR family oxidoreductase [Candidatus Omnitrophota bacterium]
MEHVSESVLVTGATGYIGGRLVPRLLEKGFVVHCLVRSKRKLQNRPWVNHPNLRVFEGDLQDRSIVSKALEGCRAAYYLVHSMMTAGDEFRDRDNQMARQFASVAEECGLSQIIYLGGLGETGPGLSEHLASRREVEECLSSTTVPVTNFRAAMIVGSGSASFEILRYLVERLPIMITPKWVQTECQPIAVRNVLFYLVDCLEKPSTLGKTLDIGGPEVMTYEEIIQIMARALGLSKRRILRVPVLTPRLSSLWIHLVTPISHQIARPLAEGLRNRVVCRDGEAQDLMPQELLSIQESIERAVGKVAGNEVETAWMDAGPIPGDPEWAGGKVFCDSRKTRYQGPPEWGYAAFTRIGGEHGYYSVDWLWVLRGWMDKMVGGPGLRRGRRHPDKVGYGEALDFWRVTDLQENRRMELKAEMKLPGKALLEFTVEPDPETPGVSVVTQTAWFYPKGLFGLLYWYMTAPFHGFVFKGMLNGIRQHALSLGRRDERDTPAMEKPSTNISN